MAIEVTISKRVTEITANNRTIEIAQGFSAVVNAALNTANVKDYGAAGDGVTDDHAAIQAAIDSGYHFIQIGDTVTEVYLISQVLVIPSNIQIVINGTIKIQDGLTATVTADVAPGATTFEVDSASNFNVGEYVVVTDDLQAVVYATYRGWGGYITDITGLVITLNTVNGLTIAAAQNARVGHCQSCFLIYEKENVKISGYGEIDGNGTNQSQFHASHTVGVTEEQTGGACINIIDSDNIELDNLKLSEGNMHTLVISGLTGGAGNTRIFVKRLNVYTGHDKNILVRFCTYGYFSDIYSEGAVWEDNLIFYASCYEINMNGFVGKDAGRYNFAWNSNSSVGLNASNIICLGTGDFSIAARDANISNVILRDEVRFIFNAGFIVKNINVSNVVIQGVTSAIILYFSGEVERVTINGLWMEGCTGTAIESWSGGTEPHHIKIIGGGIYDHTGTVEDLQVGTDIDYTAFDK